MTSGAVVPLVVATAIVVCSLDIDGGNQKERQLERGHDPSRTVSTFDLEELLEHQSTPTTSTTATSAAYLLVILLSLDAGAT
mmetsp:Transcript_14518/g.41165  ORF Transcript_14518/g.41165 Transcript_14518/m.41165 type:complete len:82 (-) Transcript_14518:515-760(-)